MRSKVWAVIGTLVLGSALFSAPRAYAKCDQTGADAGDIANARAAVATNCTCDPTGTVNHGQYVKCATEQAKATLVNQSCKGQVVRCAARSTRQAGVRHVLSDECQGRDEVIDEVERGPVQAAEGRLGVRRHLP